MDANRFTSLGDVVRPAGGAQQDAVALHFEERAVSYRDLDRRSNALANAMIAQGVTRGDRVAVLAQNCVAFVEILFAAAKAGAVLVPLNWRLVPAEIASIVADAEPALLFVEKTLERLLSEVDRDALVCLPFEDVEAPSYFIPIVDDRDPAVPVGREDLAMLVYTSGTTGHPKGAMIAHGNFSRHCGLDRPEVPRWAGIDRDEVCLVALPLFHVGGLEMLLRPLFTGATVILHRQFDLDRIIADLERYPVTLLGLVPTALQMLLEHPGSANVDFSGLRKFLYGAAPIPVELLKKGLARMQCDFVQSYGMTEANGVVAMLAPEDHLDPDAARLRSAGKPTFDARIRIVDEGGHDLPDGEIGEILVQGSGVMKGYWRRPEATADTLVDGWLRSGDAGYRDAEGFIYVCDRVKDMICSGGENIYPAEVESAIHGHPDVAEIAVVGVPDPRWGEAVRAVVVPRSGAAVDPESVIAWAGERIARYKLPRSVVVVDELPKNAAGKILRREVRDTARREMGEETT